MPCGAMVTATTLSPDPPLRADQITQVPANKKALFDMRRYSLDASSLPTMILISPTCVATSRTPRQGAIPVVLSDTLSRTANATTSSSFHHVKATRQPRPALTFRAKLELCGTPGSELLRRTLHWRAKLPLLCSEKPQNSLVCTPALGNKPRTDALLFILASNRQLAGL